MLLSELIAKINQEVKANPKVLSFEVRIDQYAESLYLRKGGSLAADILVVQPPIYRGEIGEVYIG